MIKNYKNQTSLNAVLGFLIFFLSIGTAHADLSTNPYNPETDKAKIAENLGIPESSMELDRRCVYSKTEKWLATAPRNVFQTCVLVGTDDRLILVTYNEKEDRYNSPFSYLFSEIQEISILSPQRLAIAQKNWRHGLRIEKLCQTIGGVEAS